MVALQTSDRIQVDGKNGTVRFHPLAKEDDGKYRCKAINDVGDDSTDGNLTVLGKSSGLRIPCVVCR